VDEAGGHDLEALFREHAGRVYRVAYRVTGNAGDAEDVLQTIFLRILRREDGFELGPQAASYLHRAAINAGLDLLRSRRRARAVSIDDDEESPSETLESERAEGPSARLAGREIQEQVREALGRLNPKAAEVFALRYFEGLGNTEIAEMLGTTRSAVGVTLHRSRERLKEELVALVGA
jgi:RNA polymerase sigma-70 factor (ECF subfamily)